MAEKALSAGKVAINVIQSVSSRIMSSSPRRTSSTVDLDGPLSVYEYSYSNFSYIDPRIKLFLWDKLIPTNEDIYGFIRADSITKKTISDIAFPGFFVFTTMKMYVMKITKEERGDPSTWLEKYESIPVKNVISMEPVYYMQGIAIEYSDRTAKHNRFKYLMLLHGRERSANFLSFMKKSEFFIPSKVNDRFDDDMPIIPHLEESIRYFFVSESITIYRNNDELKKFLLVGFAFTENDLFVLKTEIDWSAYETISKDENSVTIEYETKLVDLVGAEDKRSTLVLHFVDERNRIEYFWNIKTGLGINEQIVDRLNALWSPLYKVNLPVKRRAN